MRSASTVHSRLEELDLGRTFAGVLLLSHLINREEPQQLLACAARHLGRDGVLVVQRLEPGRRWQEGSSQVGPVRIRLDHLSVQLPRVSARTTYLAANGAWYQDWVLFERDDVEIALLLAQVGLELINAHGAWVTAGRVEHLEV